MRMLAVRLSVVALMCYLGTNRRRTMTRGLKLRQAGGSISATLPKDMAERLHLAAGDTVIAVETERGILLTPYDPAVEEALAIAGKVAGRYRNALRELAK
jgi:putative addiction module antidote